LEKLCIVSRSFSCIWVFPYFAFFLFFSYHHKLTTTKINAEKLLKIFSIFHDSFSMMLVWVLKRRKKNLYFHPIHMSWASSFPLYSFILRFILIYDTIFLLLQNSSENVKSERESFSLHFPSVFHAFPIFTKFHVAAGSGFFCCCCVHVFI
jgi:hypothetical protein